MTGCRIACWEDERFFRSKKCGNICAKDQSETRVMIGLSKTRKHNPFTSRAGTCGEAGSREGIKMNHDDIASPPSTAVVCNTAQLEFSSMTPRDIFAAQALPALIIKSLGHNPGDKEQANAIAARAFRIADAMMSARYQAAH
jgi:hypothetical protein